MIRVYKTKAGKNRFVQLFFSEINIAIGVSILLNLPIFLTEISLNIKAVILLATLSVCITIATLKIDGQPVYILSIDAIKYFLSPKKYTQTELVTMSEYYFKIKDNVVFTKSQVLAVIQIVPIDVSILNEQERVEFKRNMAKFIHAIGDHKSIQLKVINRLATVKDYAGHFTDLITNARQNKASSQVTKLIDEYILNLTNKVNTEKVPFKDYFLIIPVWIGSKPKPDILNTYLKELERKVHNLTGILSDNNIVTSRLEHKDLESFFRSEIRNFS